MGRPARCLINGRLVEESAARVSAFDRGFLYADGIFETLRAYSRRPFGLNRHWDRLLDSAAFLGLPRPAEQPREMIREVLSANGLDDASIRITLSRGPLPAGPRPLPEDSPQPTLLVQARPLRPNLAAIAEQGLQGRLAPWPTRARGSPLHRHKTLAYLGSVLALGAVEPDREPVLWNSHGHLAEGATSNLFWARDGTLYTPSVEAGCLPGVTRGLVLELARRRGFRVAEGLYPRAALLEAEEALLTNSVLEVAPLVAVDDRAVGDGRPGPVTRQLQQAYRHVVDEECGAS